MTNTAHTAVARLVDIDWVHPIALAPLVTLELIEQPEILPVPGSKLFLSGLLYWQQHWIPVINIRPLLLGVDRPITPKYCLIVSYKNKQTNAVSFGAVVTNKIAQDVVVSNDDFCELPHGNPIWMQIASSSFLLKEQAIPIIDSSALFNFNASK